MALPPTTDAVKLHVTVADTQQQERQAAPIRYHIIDCQFNTVLMVSSLDVAILPASHIERKFRHLADRWRKETRYISSLSKIALHPAYQKIIGMGYDAVPLILRELKDKGGHWLWALHAITDEDPAPDGAAFDEAVEAWLNWGKTEGYLI